MLNTKCRRLSWPGGGVSEQRKVLRHRAAIYNILNAARTIGAGSIFIPID